MVAQYAKSSCDQPRLSVSALTSASPPRFEPINKKTKQTFVFWIDAIRPANTWLTAIPTREARVRETLLDTTKEQDQL